MEKEYPIAHLDGLTLGDYTLNVVQLQRTKMSGWRFFAIGLSLPVQTQSDRHTKSVGTYTKSKENVLASRLPVIEGIYSSGGRGVFPWMEVFTYNSRIKFSGQAEPRPTIDLSHTGLDRTLFEHLSKLIPPGGHIMLWYEGEGDERTFQPLLKGVPPVVTKLGSLLFWAGCRLVRDFSLPEGGLEGNKKLWGEKPMNEQHKKTLQKEMARQIRSFLARDLMLNDVELKSSLTTTALKILRELKT
ncbi:MAG TPA: DUF1122 family protein [Candidatus Avalokitesvara rifleensis]|uniref:DUF1122 family protein n=1 Tax=Candidatus Avalokitesvara rifleensis TaxID=3367620 RepID=UPI002712CA8A|nr:DUF1122 family protein [Candidatus Brocadiales bacterium]